MGHRLLRDNQVPIQNWKFGVERSAFTSSLPQSTLSSASSPAQASIAPNPDGSYSAAYHLGARVALVTGMVAARPDGPFSRNVEYRDLSLNGTAKLTKGKPLTISKLNGETLNLTISKAGKAE